MSDAPTNTCEVYLNASDSKTPLCVFYNDVCYLGRQSIYNFRYSEFVFLGFKETDHSLMPAIPIIGINENQPVAAIVDDSIVREIQSALEKDVNAEQGQYNTIAMAPVAVILAVAAIDAGLIATMWAVAVSAQLNKSQP